MIEVDLDPKDVDMIDRMAFKDGTHGFRFYIKGNRIDKDKKIKSIARRLLK